MTISTLHESVCRDNILSWASNFLESLLIAWQPFCTEAICKHEQRAEALQCGVLHWDLGLTGGTRGPRAAVAESGTGEDAHLDFRAFFFM